MWRHQMSLDHDVSLMSIDLPLTVDSPIQNMETYSSNWELGMSLLVSIVCSRQ